ncbi:hypothetical protein [Streptomyces sp. NPDC089915]|uniref:hypothetical protein n=1 Tax=Streptomyces sp. NPDC089915 TaxID=3155186 RepID=UPI00343D63B3
MPRPRALGPWLATLAGGPELVVCPPYARARQTWQALADHAIMPILSQISPIPGGPAAGEACELALGDIQFTVASISGAHPHADEATTARLTALRGRLNRLRLELRPGAANAVVQAREPCRQVREDLAGGSR